MSKWVICKVYNKKELRTKGVCDNLGKDMTKKDFDQLVFLRIIKKDPDLEKLIDNYGVYTYPNIETFEKNPEIFRDII
jgi:hypothetical protein